MTTKVGKRLLKSYNFISISSCIAKLSSSWMPIERLKGMIFTAIRFSRDAMRNPALAYKCLATFTAHGKTFLTDFVYSHQNFLSLCRTWFPCPTSVLRQQRFIDSCCFCKPRKRNVLFAFLKNSRHIIYKLKFRRNCFTSSFIY